MRIFLCLQVKWREQVDASSWLVDISCLTLKPPIFLTIITQFTAPGEGRKWFKVKGFHEINDPLILIDPLKSTFNSRHTLSCSFYIAHFWALTVITRWSRVSLKSAGQDVRGLKSGTSIILLPLPSSFCDAVQERRVLTSKELVQSCCIDIYRTFQGCHPVNRDEVGGTSLFL